jgi:predicted Fe-S protein YdhL (DUF1289 family)
MYETYHPAAPSEPSTKVCTLGADGFCAGRLRTGAEIGRWISMSAAEQWQLIEELRRAFLLENAAICTIIAKCRAASPSLQTTKRTNSCPVLCSARGDGSNNMTKVFVDIDEGLR